MPTFSPHCIHSRTRPHNALCQQSPPHVGPFTYMHGTRFRHAHVFAMHTHTHAGTSRTWMAHHMRRLLFRAKSEGESGTPVAQPVAQLVCAVFERPYLWAGHRMSAFGPERLEGSCSTWRPRGLEHAGLFFGPALLCGPKCSFRASCCGRSVSPLSICCRTRWQLRRSEIHSHAGRARSAVCAVCVDAVCLEHS